MVSVQRGREVGRIKLEIVFPLMYIVHLSMAKRGTLSSLGMASSLPCMLPLLYFKRKKSRQ